MSYLYGSWVFYYLLKISWNPEPTEDAAPTQTSSPPPTEPTEEAEPKGTSSPAQSPEQEKTSEPEPEPAPEPETKTHEAASEPQPLTQQPQKAEDCQVTSTDKVSVKIIAVINVLSACMRVLLIAPLFYSLFLVLMKEYRLFF